jgi:hypothetical protein
MQLKNGWSKNEHFFPNECHNDIVDLNFDHPMTPHETHTISKSNTSNIN